MTDIQSYTTVDAGKASTVSIDTQALAADLDNVDDNDSHYDADDGKVD